jgi:kojibiose phosphorylase
MYEENAGGGGGPRATQAAGGAAVDERERALQRPFRIIAFDWDGTAVVNRLADATPVRRAIERLLELAVNVVVITGTNFQNVDRQLSASIVGPHKRRLYACTNRGSEVYGFADGSQPVLIWQRVATPEENHKLTEIADSVRRTVERRTGLEVHVVYNRLNRRKIDVIPVPEWADPPKAQIGDLLQAVETRLVGGGVAGGLREVYQLTMEVAAEKGLKDARITSDVKHIEVGLTDKEDSINWLVGELAARHGIPPEDILIGGDVFGPIAGFEGSDYKMYSPSARGAVYMSVGAEPNGVPPGVIHIGGGPQRFLEFLEEQIRLHEALARAGAPPAEAPSRPSVRMAGSIPTSPATPPLVATEVAAEPGWRLLEKGFEIGREHEVESLFTVANGYVGVRGSLSEIIRESWPATFLAGVFDKPPDNVTELVVQPDWTRLRVYVEGEEVRLFAGETVEHRRTLDLRRGASVREWRQRDATGRVTRLYFVRFVSLADRGALVESVTIVPENYSGTISLECMLDGRVNNMRNTKHLEVLETAAIAGERNGRVPSGEASPPLLLRARTLQSRIEVALAASGVLHTDEDLVADHVVIREDSFVGERWQWEAEMGTAYRFDKLVAAASSRDGDNPAALATARLDAYVKRGVDDLFQAHVRAWGERWEDSDVRVAGSDADQLAARFAVHHLVQSANPEDERVSIGARGLTGESYKGHVFWDTDIYVVPFFSYTYPEAARSLLMYRYHTLPGARAKARAMDYRGANYAWESADTGEEVTPTFGVGAGGVIIPILTGQQEHHITADVTYATWQYWQATGDDDFFQRAGAEIVLDTSRFWASRVRRGEDGLYHILEVIGPDEYHEGVDDNAFTNVMAQWNLERGLATATLLRERWPQRWAELAESLEIDDAELARWREVAEGMYTGFDPQTGLFEQFRGYFALEDIDLSQFEPRTASMEVLVGRERLQKSQILKQSDVVMLMYLLWDRFPAEVREANFRYYAPRCAHGSSLSPSIHALMAARLGEVELARHYYRQAAEIDLANNMGNASGGVHTACQGGLWQALVFGFGGLHAGADGVTFDPRPLPEWRELTYGFQWRGRRLMASAAVSPRSLQVEVRQGEPLPVHVGEGSDHAVTLEPGKAQQFTAQKGHWRPAQEHEQ